MKKALKIIGIIILIIVLLFGGLLIYLTTQEYKPNDIETIAVENAHDTIKLNKNNISVLSFNTGYAGLGNNADFFMDGGKNVKSTDKERMDQNMQDINSIIKSNNADFTILQEVDQNSHRTYDFNQVNSYIKQNNLSGSFALNYSCPFVPYPVPPIGKVNAGQLTLTPFAANNTKRYSLPCPFSWPIRTANLKRCLLVSHYPIENSDKELVIMNLHLEAYDDGEGKIAQTKMLLNLLEEEYAKGNYVIAGGDFNQTFPGGIDEYPMIDEKLWQPGTLDNSMLPDGWQYAYDLSTPSCRSLDKPYDINNKNNQYYTLDGFIVSPNIEISNVKVLDYNFKASDHNPVLLNATLK